MVKACDAVAAAHSSTLDRELYPVMVNTVLKYLGNVLKWVGVGVIAAAFGEVVEEQK